MQAHNSRSSGSESGPRSHELSSSPAVHVDPEGRRSLADYLSSTMLITRRGVQNLLGQVLTAFESRSTTGLRHSSGDIYIATEDNHLHRLDRSGALLESLVTPSMVTALYENPYDKSVLVGLNRGILGQLKEGVFEANLSFQHISTRALWHTPWDKDDFDVHSFAHGAGGRLYAAIHVGGVVRSTDKGRTWTQLSSGMSRIVTDSFGQMDIDESGDGLNPDVHQLVVHPSRPEILMAATRDGFYISSDGGVRFTASNEGILSAEHPANYQRALGIFPDTDTLLCASALGPGSMKTTRMFRSENLGKSWEPVFGLPDPAEHIDTIQCSRDGRAIALVGNSIFFSEDYGLHWQELPHAPRDFYTDRKHHVVRPLFSL